MVLLIAIAILMLGATHAADSTTTPTNVSTSEPVVSYLRNTTEFGAYYLYENFTPTMALADNESLTNQSADVIHNTAIRMTFCMLYTSIFVLGVFGNALVCYVVLNNKAMQTVTNLFITNLALSDILLCVLAVPFTPLYTFLDGWVFGTVMCHVVPYAQGCSVYISTLTLTSIAIDRFFVIISPFHPRMKLSTCLSIIVLIWVFSLVVTIPYGMYVQIVRTQKTVYCEEFWPSEYFRKVYSLSTTSLQFLLPFVIIAFCYICVSVRLNNRAKAKPGTKTSKRDEADRERKKRTNRMLICMVAIFGVSWLPLNVVNVVNDFHLDTNDWRFYNLLFFLAHLTAMSSTCYNPFLYAWLNENFRKEFKQVLPCFDPSHGRGGSSTTSHQWRSGRTCNGNGNETIQETLLPSTINHEIQPRSATKETGMRAESQNSSQNQLVDTILLNDIKPPLVSHEETTILPSGVIETKFDNICLMPTPVGLTQLAAADETSIKLPPPSAMKKHNTVKSQQKRLTIDDGRDNNCNSTYVNGFEEANGSKIKLTSSLPVASDMISLINTDSMMIKKQH